MTSDVLGERVEVGDVVRLLDGVAPQACYALVESDVGDGTLMVRQFDRTVGAWKSFRRRWRCANLRRDPHRGCMADGQRNNPVFVDRLREW